MLADMKRLVLEAEEEEHVYTMNQEYIMEQEAKANGDITDKDMQDMAAYYEDKAKGIER